MIFPKSIYCLLTNIRKTTYLILGKITYLLSILNRIYLHIINLKHIKNGNKKIKLR